VRRLAKRLVVAAVLGVTAFAIVRSDPAAIARSFATMSWRWAIVASLINLAGVVADAARLRIVVGALGPVTMWSALHAQLVGIVGNVLFPFKLGEGARAYVLSQRSGLPTATAVTMVVLDRVLDALVLPLFVLIASVLLPLPPNILRLRSWMAAALTAAAFAGVLLKRSLRARYASTRTPAALAGWRDRFLAGATVLGHRQRLAAAIVASMVSWVLRAAILWCMFGAFGLEVPVSAAVSVLVMVNLGIAVVATPGNAGTFELTTAASLLLWGVSADTALTVAIATHAVEVVPPVLIGLAISVRSPLRQAGNPLAPTSTGSPDSSAGMTMPVSPTGSIAPISLS
jgi:uncharacterized protein (TIRG00374 family)